MNRPERWVGIALASVALVGSTAAWGQNGRDAPAASARSSLPPGHPALEGAPVPAGPLPHGDSDDGEDPDEEEAPLPPGHPATTAKPAEGAVDTFTPPPDTESEDAALPTGTIEVDLRDPDNHVMPQTPITLGMIHQSVAKGESREHKGSVSDARGVARFDGLETGSGIAYRLSVPRDGATFAAVPFQLPAQKGMRVVLHVYPVTRDIQEALVVMQGVLFAEVKDDRVQIEEAFTIFNLGKVAWVADGALIRLPEEFTALSAQQTMSDQGLDPADKQGGRLRGTFGPGRHELQFRWQLPYSGDKTVDFEAGLPPHVAAVRVIAAAAKGVKLHVVGFPDAERRTDAQGQKLLVTEKQVRRDDPITSLHVTLEGLPTPGPWRVIATVLAGLVVGLGLTISFGREATPERSAGEKARRNHLLAELADLERARKDGDIGPRTYERARRELIDAIARTLGPSPSTPPQA